MSGIDPAVPEVARAARLLVPRAGRAAGPESDPVAAAAADGDLKPAFPPGSMLWRLCRERCNLLDGPAAAVLQVAHPKIAAGVRDHSDFETSPMARLERTLVGVNTIAFGTAAEARAMARHIARRHAVVRGRVDGVGGQPSTEPGTDAQGAAYSAADPELLLWVIATLVMAAVNGYERVFGPLSADELQAFYDDMRVFGRYFGLDPRYGPMTWVDFLRYWHDMLAGPVLGSHPVTRRVAWSVARPRRPWWLRLASGPMRFVFSEVIPPPVRDRLGFRSTRFSRLSMRTANAVLPWVVPWLPRRLRFAPEYLRAVERMGIARNEGMRE